VIGHRSGNKYKAIGVHTDDGYFHSKKELNRWRDLKLLEQLGEIRDLKRQERFQLFYKSNLPENYLCVYVSDFTYWDIEKFKWICEDVKGYKGGVAYQLFKIKRKIFEWNYPHYLFLEI